MSCRAGTLLFAAQNLSCPTPRHHLIPTSHLKINSGISYQAVQEISRDVSHLQISTFDFNDNNTRLLFFC